MEIVSLENLTFSYPGSRRAALRGISLSVKSGEFITLCGKSGSGKTTLLKLLKPPIAPHGEKSGSVRLFGEDSGSLSHRRQSAEIGFVMQNPDDQIVTDKVWHELAFGLEGLSLPTAEIRARVSETASFFGIQSWFHQKTDELSGGQKQLLNLAAVMVMQPKLLLLDEPTSRLDPIAAQNFFGILSKINRELGTTVIMSEHRLEDAFPVSDRIIVTDGGKIIADSTPQRVGAKLFAAKNDMFCAMPAAMRISAQFAAGELPVTVREARDWLSNRRFTGEPPKAAPSPNVHTDFAVRLKNVWFRYESNSPDVIKGLSLDIRRGEIYSIVGGNGSGKTTALSLICGLLKPQRGSVKTGSGLKTVMLPQNPCALFSKSTVADELAEMLPKSPSAADAEHLRSVISLCMLGELTDRNPYDLSGGEQQRAALAKVLLAKPSILLLDEPTKALDAHCKALLSDILFSLKKSGATIIMVSHDIEFCAECADSCAMFFDGAVTSEGAPRSFFSEKSFYTTAANRIARGILPNAVTVNDIVSALGGKTEDFSSAEKSAPTPCSESGIADTAEKPKRHSLLGCTFALSAFAAQFLSVFSGIWVGAAQIISSVFILFAMICFFPQRKMRHISIPSGKTRRGALIAPAIAVLAAACTILIGKYALADRQYYIVSLLIIFETLIAFFFSFEKRKPQTRELALISVICAMTAAGRAAFFMLPQFKPVAAVVIVTGLCFGSEYGFLVGSVSAFLSNYIFGQSPLSPWQMFAFGLIGFIFGTAPVRKAAEKGKFMLCALGFLSVLVIYGGILNPAALILWQSKPSLEMLIASYAAGLPFDLVHAAATAFFLWFAADSLIERLERIKIKYGM